jgi:hypothetical protein
VLRDGDLMVTLHLQVLPTDQVITKRWLKPGQVPRWLLTYYDINRNWDVLRTCDITMGKNRDRRVESGNALARDV